MFANQLQVMLFCVSLVKLLTVVWYKMLLQYAGQLVDLPDDQFIKQAFRYAQQQRPLGFRSCLAGHLIMGFRV